MTKHDFFLPSLNYVFYSLKVLYIYTMYKYIVYSLYLPSSNSLPPSAPKLTPFKFQVFSFFLHLLSITIWSNQRACGHSLGYEQPTSVHLTEREQLFLLQQPSTSASDSSVGGGTLWDPPHPCWNLNWLDHVLVCAGNRAAES